MLKSLKNTKSFKQIKNVASAAFNAGKRFFGSERRNMSYLTKPMKTASQRADDLVQEGKNIVKDITNTYNGIDNSGGKHNSKTGKFVENLVHPLPMEKRNSLTEKAMPYRFNNWVSGTIVAGSGIGIAANFARDGYQSGHIRQIGSVGYGQMNNMVSEVPSAYSASFIKQLPEQIHSSLLVDAADAVGIKGYGTVPFNDHGAGGDLVFAMHNMR